MTSSGGNWKDLLKAAGEGNVKLVQYHLREGVDPNFQHAEYFTCPIFEAVRKGHLDVVKILVEQGKADPNIVEELTDQTPMEAALDEGQHDIVEYLNDRLPKDFQYKFHNVLVTGGNRGIGKAICESLLKKGHRVAFTCRSQKDGEAALLELRETTKNNKVDFILGDLSSVKSAYALAQSIATKFPTMNVLVHNAGLWPTEKIMTPDGLELAFCVNYLAPYILTQELGPILEKNGPDSRIVFVSGKIYVKGNADISTTPFGKDFNRFKTYMHTKQCGVILFLNTARRFQGTCVKVNAVHPGVIRTGLGESAKSSCFESCLLGLIKRLWKDPSDGAVGPVWLAASPEAAAYHGNYYDELQLDSMPDSVTDLSVQRDWEQWTMDFLEAIQKSGN